MTPGKYRQSCRPLLGALTVVLALASLGAMPATAEAQGWNATWTQKAYPSPGPRGWIDMTFDTVNGRAVLFGGSASWYLDDVWQYDLTADSWVELEPSPRCPTDFVPPAGRDEYALEYDTTNQLYWVFGGSGSGCNGPPRIAGAGTTRIAIVDATLPATPVDFYKDWTVAVFDFNGVPWTAYVSAYDPVSKTLTLTTPLALVVPGNQYFLYAQRGGGTFSYSPVTRTWSSLTGPHWRYNGPEPSNRLSPAMAYSTRDTAIVMFGGQGWNDTWALDSNTKSWVQMIPNGTPGSPPGLAQLTNSMVYDSDSDVFILFGGCLCTGDGGPSSNDTWVYRLSTNTWTKMSTTVSPPPRHGHNLVYDSTNKVVVLFGGYDERGPTHYNDLWVYRLATNTWTQVFPSTSPPGRRTGAMAYDPVRQLTVLYAGKNTGPLPDVWTLQLQGSGTSNPAPSLTSLSPTGAAAGSPGFTITVTGANFVSSSVIRWNGASRPTTYVRSTQLQASIPATDIASVGTSQVTVVTPTPGGGASSRLSFSVTAPAPVPTLTGISPSSVSAGGSAFTLTATGTSFTAASVIQINGSVRATSVVNSGRLTATIPASDIATSGARYITVFTPGPVGGTTAARALSVSGPPALSASATTAQPGGSITVTLTNGPGGSTDWLGLGAVGTADVGSNVKWTYVGAGVTTRTWTVKMPTTSGRYEFRLFVNDGYTRMATSLPVIVVGPSLSVTAIPTPTGQQQATVTLTNGLGGATDWLALCAAGSPNTSYLQWVYVGAGVSNRTWTVTLPTGTAQYEFRLYLNNAWTRAATSPSFAVSSPVASLPGS